MDVSAAAVARERVERLLAEMERLPSRPSAALRVLWLVDDPSSNAADLANAIHSDVALCARVLRIANSAYYSPHREIADVRLAVSAIGFSAVRALAATAACEIRPRDVPAGFWAHSSVVANAAALLAAHFAVPANDAFALGLLHDTGVALLSRADPSAWRELSRAGGGDDREATMFGITHGEAAARVFDAWRLPPPLCDAIAHHGDPSDTVAAPHVQVMHAAEQIAVLLGVAPFTCRPTVSTHELLSVGIDADRLDRILVRVRADAGPLAEALAV